MLPPAPRQPRPAGSAPSSSNAGLPGEGLHVMRQGGAAVRPQQQQGSAGGPASSQRPQLSVVQTAPSGGPSVNAGGAGDSLRLTLWDMWLGWRGGPHSVQALNSRPGKALQGWRKAVHTQHRVLHPSDHLHVDLPGAGAAYPTQGSFHTLCGPVGREASGLML